LIERVLPTGPASTPDPVPAWMAGAGSGVIPRKATLEPPVLPANRRSRRQPPGRTRDSIPLSENHAPIPPPDSGAGPACERQRPEPRSCQPLPRRRTRSLRHPNRPLLRCGSTSRYRPALPIATSQCSRPGGRLRTTGSVAKRSCGLAEARDGFVAEAIIVRRSTGRPKRSSAAFAVSGGRAGNSSASSDQCAGRSMLVIGG
jgi:hypothetical protein